VSIPAATNASAALGPIPSMITKSSPFLEALAFGAFSSTASTNFSAFGAAFSVLGATVFSAFGASSFLGAAFLPPVAEIDSITI
jgi:hypothetical protein